MPDPADALSASERLRAKLRHEFTFQISVDTDSLDLGLVVARAALDAGITIVEMGTPLLKCAGVYNVVPAFRRAFPKAILLADMKTMDGGGFEARAVFQGGGNIIDFLGLSGKASARAICAVRDELRQNEPEMARLVFADILLRHGGPVEAAADEAERMLDAGVDGVGIHLQLDARRADPELFRSSFLSDVAEAVFARVGARASVQVVGGLSVERARGLARAGLRAFVISGNLGLPDSTARFTLPADTIRGHVADFIREVSAG